MMKKALYFGLGALFMTRDKAEQMVNEMVEKGEINRDEAKKFIDEAIKRGEEEKTELRDMIQKEVQELKQTFAHPRQSEIEELKARIQALEEQLAQQQQQ